MAEEFLNRAHAQTTSNQKETELNATEHAGVPNDKSRCIRVIQRLLKMVRRGGLEPPRDCSR
jgi:hypothetical protein